ncbi:MAG: Hsp70 family protein, partial [Holosporaceae bacterium]|nr:Hsp70 family protein [Holosporaceae bacterium]
MATIGIDLGTTASVVSSIKDGAPTPIIIGGAIMTPSVVNYSEDHPIVGREAIYQLDSGRTIFSVKRFMGSDRKLCGKSPVEISADILLYLKHHVEEAIGEKIDAAIITVPAHFSDLQRTATRQAASIAGIRVLRLINEPTAAAVAFGLDKKENGIFAVYDFGGGTFDFSVLRLAAGIFQVLAAGGDNYLGGDDVDNAILAYNFRIHDLDINSAGENEKISGKMTAKIMKEQLADLPEIRKNYVYKNKNYEFLLSPEILEEVSRDFLQKTMKIADYVLKDSGVENLDGVVMVGGMTRLKLVKNAVRSHFK